MFAQDLLVLARSVLAAPIGMMNASLGWPGLPPSSGPGSMLVHGGPRVHRDDGFRRWATVSQGAVGPDGVVMATLFLDQDLGLLQGVEDLSVEEFVAESGIEAFAISVLPR